MVFNNYYNMLHTPMSVASQEGVKNTFDYLKEFLKMKSVLIHKQLQRPRIRGARLHGRLKQVRGVIRSFISYNYAVWAISHTPSASC